MWKNLLGILTAVGAIVLISLGLGTVANHVSSQPLQPVMVDGVYKIKPFKKCDLSTSSTKKADEVMREAELWMNSVDSTKVKIINHSLTFTHADYCAVVSVLCTEEKVMFDIPFQ